ncbi:hypothetical protein MED193_22311 [Roseobacter sp. MED193]|uniref:hypothetical protein n=1 Tax=Roseobacter sp. MED193 TaxID=314262 RepID=UPI000068BB83|nr:hypothetical protein [Roseobacter sp. MED193]EAQ44890.1 hypothetical protein MED193_22311 [Roseobacter sp. MED193]
MTTLAELDHKQLIREAYRIEGITESQCRSIFLDWALSLPAEFDNRSAITQIMAHYSREPQGHPMTQVLQQGLDESIRPRRRGGWRSRSRD